jgi:hypothetical protein
MSAAGGRGAWRGELNLRLDAFLEHVTEGRKDALGPAIALVVEPLGACQKAKEAEDGAKKKPKK